MSKAHHYNYISACPTTVSSSSLYSLISRQQPIHARISTNNERDRRPIDPPPIIQIKLTNATPQETDTFHQSSYFFMCANLAHVSDDNEIYTPTHNALSGQTVSSMYKLKDIDNDNGAFFVFGDLSVKVEGQFRLKLSLFEITCTGAVCLQSIFTSPFIVYPSKKFPGALDSTFLSRNFSDQGARIRIKKENRSQLSTSNTPCKRKLEIQTEPTSPTGQHPYLERRGSITNSDTTESNSSQGSPVTSHLASPCAVSLPPLSPPTQSYDKQWLPSDYSQGYCLHPEPTIRLPPISSFLPLEQIKRQKTEDDSLAAAAMIQLHHQPYYTAPRKHHLIHLN